MTQKRPQNNDENEDPQRERGVEDGVGQKKNIRGGNNGSCTLFFANTMSGYHHIINVGLSTNFVYTYVQNLDIVC